jgi:hypothetical protein
MNTFFITAVVKGLDTSVVVEEPKKWDVPEFLISVNNPVIEERFFIKLNKGLWQHSIPGEFLDSARPGKMPTICSLEPLEIESIGMEIAKSWRTRLSKSLEVFEQLF